jgi:type II secretory pathway pseudopilin PulG
MSFNRRERGFSLIAAMIVITIATLMVVGAIAYTGSERAAAVQHSRSERLSGCVQAARNLFFSQMRVLQGNVANTTVDAGVAHDGNLIRITTGHYGSVAISAVKKLGDSQVAGAGEQVYDISNVVGKPKLLAGYYSVTAVCQEKATGLTGSLPPEQEIEFVVRVGL